MQSRKWGHMIYDDLYSYLIGQSTITALVGTRVYPLHLPQNPTLPALTMEQTQAEYEYCITGSANWAAPTIRISVYSESLPEIATIAEALRNVLQGYKGTMGAIRIHYCTLTNTEDEAFTPDDASDYWIYARHSDYQMKHTETPPSFS